MEDTHIRKTQQHPGMYVENKYGWNLFSPEVAWFIYDFFKYDLNGYEKLIFYSYYVNGMTLESIGKSAGCTFQNIGMLISKLDKRLHWAWKNKDEWKELHKDDRKQRDPIDSRGDKKGSKRRRRLIHR